MTASAITGVIPGERAESRTFDVAWPLAATLFASLCIVVGLIWDISWHRTVGRDTFWTYPHVLEQIAAIVSGLGCGWIVLRTTFAGSADERAISVRFWRFFQAPLGAWVCIWGTIAMIASAPFDNWWHNAYGLDVKIISPPHTVLAAGMIAIQIGAMLMAVAAQNRASDEAQRGYAFAYALAFGILLTMMLTVLMEYSAFPNEMHGSRFYRALAMPVPLVLVAGARASRLRWPATTAAAIYAGIVLLIMWTLQLFPATPKLAPIYNPVTHMVPPPFPLLLVVPALGIDLLMKRWRTRSDWLLALAIAVVFVFVLAAVNWKWADFLLSPHARNFFFASDQWDYNQPIGAWRYRFWNLDGPNRTFALAPFLLGMARATLYATISARIGLWLGRGLARVQR
jgi:hypothetical protein